MIVLVTELWPRVGAPLLLPCKSQDSTAPIVPCSPENLRRYGSLRIKRSSSRALPRPELVRGRSCERPCSHFTVSPPASFCYLQIPAIVQSPSVQSAILLREREPKVDIQLRVFLRRLIEVKKWTSARRHFRQSAQAWGTHFFGYEPRLFLFTHVLAARDRHEVSISIYRASVTWSRLHFRRLLTSTTHLRGRICVAKIANLKCVLVTKYSIQGLEGPTLTLASILVCERRIA